MVSDNSGEDPEGEEGAPAKKEKKVRNKLNAEVGAKGTDKYDIVEVERWLGHPITELKHEVLCASKDNKKRVLFKADRNPVGILQFTEKSDDNKKPVRQGVNFADW